MSELELIATAGFGLEAVVARELKALGYADQQVEDGRVTFIGDEQAICRTNLRLRSAERVLLKVGSFEARDFGELFDPQEIAGKVVAEVGSGSGRIINMICDFEPAVVGHFDLIRLFDPEYTKRLTPASTRISISVKSASG